MKNIMKQHMTKLLLATLLATALFINADCKKDIVDPPIEDLKPGSRNYTWTVDTLKLPFGDVFTPSRIWGSSSNDVWITGFGDGGDLIWHFDGTQWTRDSTRYLISPSALWGTARNNIWMGNSNNTFWRYDGAKWYKFSEHKLTGFDRIVIENIWETSANDLWAVGGADQFNGGTQYKGIVMHFDGVQWQFMKLPDLKTGFTEIFQQQATGLFFLGGGGYDSSGYNYKLFVYDGNIITLINSNYLSGSHVYQIKGEVYFAIGQKIYKYLNNIFQQWKDFSNTNYRGVVYGRTEKDFFTLTSSDFISSGIGHYNGTDLQTIYTLPPNYRISGLMVFEKEIFFQSFSTTSNTIIVIHGKLRD
jgi:hypothetical protein